MGGAFGEMMMAAIGGVVCFVVIKEVMSGQNTTSWLLDNGLHIWATDMDMGTNSVNPKPFRHGNTEPSINFNKFRACVETMCSLPQVGKDIVRTLWKHSEPTGNKLVALKKCGNRLQAWKLPCLQPSCLYWPQSVSSLLYSQYSSG
jgi:hypothetical protein